MQPLPKPKKSPSHMQNNRMFHAAPTTPPQQQQLTCVQPPLQSQQPPPQGVLGIPALTTTHLSSLIN